MKEKVNSGDRILCWGMLMLTLCAAVLGTAFYLAAEKEYQPEKQVLDWVPDKGVPESALRCEGTSLRYEGQEIAVYELEWEEEKEGKAVYRKWRYFVETETHQPRRIEKYRKDDPNGEYVLEETVTAEYPTDGQMREAIKDVYK